MTGIVYTGEFLNDRRHGQGRMEFFDGDGETFTLFLQKNCYIFVGHTLNCLISFCLVYEGTWKDDAIDGKGRMQYTSGSLYVGYWKNGLFDGYGWFVSNSGEEYEGVWHKGEPAGGKNKDWTTGIMYDGDVPTLCATWSSVARF